MKLLRRRVFCREKDFEEKIKPKATRVGYHRCYWQPITITEVKEEITWFILKHGELFWDKKSQPVMMLKGVESSDNVNILVNDYIQSLKNSGLLYSQRWTDWHWKFENDHIWLRYFPKFEWQPIGVAVLERDY